jgi:PAS domain S-box-containing protein
MAFSAYHIRDALRLFLITMFVVLAFLNTSLAEPVNELKRPISTIAVIHCDYGPVSFWNKNTNTPSGFFVDIMGSIAARAGVRVSYICRYDWDDTLVAIESGKADFGVLLKSGEREKKVLFSTPIQTTYLSFFARSESDVDPARVPSDHVVGVIKGSMSYEKLKDRDGVRLQIYGGYREGLFGLLAGEISLFAGEESMVLKQMRETGLEDRIKKVGKPFFELQRCLAVRRDNVQLLELMNKTLKDFVGGPEYQQIYLKWYGAPEPYWTNRRVLTVSGVFLIIAIGGIAFWRYASIKKINTVLRRTIDERKLAEMKLRESEQITRNILDAVDEGFIVIDREFRILTANRAYCDQAGMTSEEVIGRKCHDISHSLLLPCYEEGEDCAVRHVFDTGEPHIVVHRHGDDNGPIRYVETKAFPLKDSSGAVTSVIEEINNITEKRLLEEERLKTHKLEAVGILAGGIAHDFNNLLQGVFGYISMAKLTLDQKERSLAMLNQAEQALHMSVKLTSQLLTFSKGGKPIKKKMWLKPVIENSVMFALSGSSVDCRIRIDEDLWPVEADEGQIAQVVQNIVINADQAMPSGGTIAITAKNVLGSQQELPQSLKEEKYVEISIQDGGTGIAQQHMHKIFDPYFTTKEKGSGIGLATSYSIIKNHGGAIDLASELGKGATFFVYLPAVEAGKEDPAASAVSPNGRKWKILLMDDDELIRNIAGEMIQALGHDVDFAEYGESAIEKFRTAKESGNPFDIVILDLTIRGGLGGKETIEQLLMIDPGVRAVVSSGYSDDAVVSDYHKYGFSSRLTKPYKFEKLRVTLNDLMSR